MKKSYGAGTKVGPHTLSPQKELRANFQCSI